MYYKVKNVSFQKGKMYVTAAPNNVRPITYRTFEYTANGECETPLRHFLRHVANGNYQPIPSCKIGGQSLFRVTELMGILEREAPDIEVQKDLRLNCAFMILLEKQLADCANEWLHVRNLRITESDLNRIRELNMQARETYAKSKADLMKRGIMLISCASRSDIFEGYDALLSENGAMFLGKADRYDNRGHYNNSDHSAICLAENEEKAHILFGFFANAYVGKGVEKPDVEWEKLYSIPGYKIAEKLYTAL